MKHFYFCIKRLVAGNHDAPNYDYLDSFRIIPVFRELSRINLNITRISCLIGSE